MEGTPNASVLGVLEIIEASEAVWVLEGTGSTVSQMKNTLRLARAPLHDRMHRVAAFVETVNMGAER